MKYAIGIDYGTGSGRIIIVNIYTGEVISISVVKYKSGTIQSSLNNQPIPNTYALQDATDYMDVLIEGIPSALKQANINKEDIVGVGIDFTSSTIVIADEQLQPLSSKENFKNNPHAYVKLWKHHGASKEAEKMYDIAKGHNHNWLGNYGYNVSSEWMIPKVLELIHQDSEVLHETAYIMEAGDWIVSNLIDENVRSNCARGFKTFWNEEDGFFYDYYEKLHPNLPNVIKEKLEGRLVKIGEQAGTLTPKMSQMLGLPKGLPVASAIIDAHSALLGVGSIQKNQLTMVMGTSTCHLMLHEEQKQIHGISGSVKDAIVPGLYAYEAGQSAVGDLFEHVVHQVPESYEKEARERNICIHTLLEEKAATKRAGETGLVALDWHNGNRSILSNSNLRGLVIGQTLHTKVEDIYRAYMEATAFGTKMIAESYKDWGMQIEEIYACGGLPQKNALLMQIYADILNKPIHVSATDYAPAFGAAILGAVAGKGHETIEDGIKHMKQALLKTVYPIEKNVAIYQKLFEIYKELHDFYGKTRPDFMQQLKEISE